MRWVCHKCGKVEKSERVPEGWMETHTSGFARVKLTCPACSGRYAVKHREPLIRHRRGL